MAVKGKIKTQTQYQKEIKFQELLKEAFHLNEITKDQILGAFKILGFSPIMANSKANEWVSNRAQLVSEIKNTPKKRAVKLASIEKQLLQYNTDTRKKYNELIAAQEIKFIFS